MDLYEYGRIQPHGVKTPMYSRVFWTQVQMDSGIWDLHLYSRKTGA